MATSQREPHGDAMRAQVADSWDRSAAAGVAPESEAAPITLELDALNDLREAHPLSQVFPLLDDVLGQAARDCDAVMAVSDADAQLLWVCGDTTALTKAEAIGFVEGSNWDERLAGTNAPGMALTLGQPSMIVGAEHFRHSVQQWSCAAAPIHDPGTGEVLGVLDITGTHSIVVPQTMALIRAAVRLAENELAHQRGHTTQPRESARHPVRLQALGRDEALLSMPNSSRVHRLSRRHSEIFALLAAHPEGLSGDELGLLLYGHDLRVSTLRAEMNRLRGLFDELVGSRPYRLLHDIGTDWAMVRAQLSAGDLGAALRLFRGPLLPRSTAPGIQDLRDEQLQAVRAAVLSSGSAGAMSRWTRTPWGADDYDMWLAQRDAVGPTSALLPLIHSHIARLDREFGLPAQGHPASTQR